jgi:hypothetical protein
MWIPDFKHQYCQKKRKKQKKKPKDYIFILFIFLGSLLKIIVTLHICRQDIKDPEMLNNLTNAPQLWFEPKACWLPYLCSFRNNGCRQLLILQIWEWLLDEVTEKHLVTLVRILLSQFLYISSNIWSEKTNQVASHQYVDMPSISPCIKRRELWSRKQGSDQSLLLGSQQT